MSIGAILGAIAAIVTGIVWIWKRIDWQAGSTPEDKKQAIDKGVDDRTHQTEQDGRPH